MGAAIWDATTGKRGRVFEASAERSPLSAAFSPNGDYLTIGYKDRAEAHFLGGDVKKDPERIYRVDGVVTAIAYDADTKRIALGIRKPLKSRDDAEPEILGHKSDVVVFDVKTAEELKRLEGFEGAKGNIATMLPVTAIAFSPDGKHLAAGTGVHFSTTPVKLPKSGEIKVWKLDQ